MTAQPRGSQIARTPDAIADALSGAQRMAFYRELGSAEQGEQLDGVIEKWRMEAMFEQVPNRRQRLDNVRAGRNLRPLPDLIEETE